MNVRVLLCSGSLDGGGSERQLVQLTRGLERNEFEPHVYLLYCRGAFLQHLPSNIPVDSFWPTADAQGASGRDKPARGWLTWPGRIHGRQVRHLAQVLRDRKIDVVYDRTFHMTLVTAPACRRAGVPRVSVIVSPPSRDFAGSRERFRWFKRRRLAKAYRDKSAITLAVSEATARDAESFYGLPVNSLCVVRNPVDVDRIVQAAGDVSSPQPDWAATWNSEDLNVAVVGRMSAEKGQRVAIEATAEAARRGCRVHLHLVGDGPLRTELESLAFEQGIAPKVSFHGFLENPYPLIKAASLVCIPSEYEGLPNVALEALALQTPLVATRCSDSLHELLGENQRGVLVPVHNAQALADAWLELSEEPAAWAKRVASGLAEIQENYDVSAWLNTMGEMLTKLARRGQA